MKTTRLCECGCGGPAPIAKRTWKRRGWVKGQPVRFILGHNALGKQHTLRHGAARHGQETPEYTAYRNAKKRCTDPNDRGWRNYGGRGIKFLFARFENFLAEVGLKPSALLMLDRTDNNSHYMPGNLRWASPSQSARNRRPRCPS